MTEDEVSELAEFCEGDWKFLLDRHGEEVLGRSELTELVRLAQALAEHAETVRAALNEAHGLAVARNNQEGAKRCKQALSALLRDLTLSPSPGDDVKEGKKDG